MKITYISTTQLKTTDKDKQHCFTLIILKKKKKKASSRTCTTKLYINIMVFRQ